MDRIGLAVLTGTSPVDTNEIHEAIATRFNQIRGNFVKRSGDYLYGGNRCAAENLGWRMCQSFCGLLGSTDGLTVEEILSGKHDKVIEDTWHEAASAEHWYRYEKQWD